METILKKKLKDYRLFVIVNSLLILLTNIFTLVMELITGYEIIYYAFTIGFVVMDLIFTTFAFTSNFKFKYAKVFTVVYFLYIIFVTLAMVYIYNPFSSVAVFTTTAAIVNGACHLISAIIVLIIASMAKVKSIKNGIVSTIFSILTALSCAFLVLFILNYGFFGQGDTKNIVYKFNANDNTYSVSNVLCGKSSTVEINDTFNGLPIKNVSSELLCRTDIEEINFVGNSEISFVFNTENKEFNSNIKISISKKNVQHLRENIYSYIKSYKDNKNAAVSILNNAYPILEDDEAYLKFTYDDSSIDLLMDTYPCLPLLYGKLGENYNSFSGYDDLIGQEYTRHGNKKDEDLIWNYENNNGLIVLGFERLEELDKANSKELNINISFDRVLELDVTSNDDKYHIPEDVKQTGTKNKLVSLATITDYVNETLKETDREGFDKIVTFNDKSYDKFKKELNKTDGSKIAVKLAYSMIKPEITLNKNKPSYIYGDNLTIDYKLTNKVNGFNYSVKWTRTNGEKDLGTNNTLSLNKVTTDLSDVYICEITSSSSGSSLTSTNSSNIQVSIEKRIITSMLEEDEENSTYDGNEKNISVSIDGILEGDESVYSVENDKIIGAGEYKVKVSITDSYFANYMFEYNNQSNIQSNTHIYTVKPKEVTGTWDNDKYVYDGEPHRNTYTAKGVDGLVIDVIYTGLKTNVYDDITTTATSNNKNYVFDEATNTKKVTIVKADYEGFIIFEDYEGTYDGNEHTPSVKELPTGADGVRLGYSYDKKIKNVDESGVVTISFIPSGNYNAPADITKTVTIKPKNVKVNWSNNIFTFDGKAHTLTAYINGVGADEMIDLKVEGEKTIVSGNVDATASLVNNNNYSLEDSTCPIIINPKEVDVSWSNPSKVYDGNPFTPSATFIDVEGISQSLDVIGSKINVDDTDKATATLDNPNYKLRNSTTDITITPCEVTINWGQNEFIYDGKPHSLEPEAIGVTNTSLPLSITNNSKTDVEGSVIVKASLSNNNYKLVNPTCDLIIKPKKVDAIWSNTSKVYDGTPLTPSATFIDVEGISQSLHVTGSKTNVNDQSIAEIVVADDFNYTFTNPTHEITINPTDCNAIASDVTVTYDGNSHMVEVDGLNSEVKPVFKYKDEIVTGITDVGSYEITVEYVCETGNYNVPAKQIVTLTIKKIKVNVEEIVEFIDENVDYTGSEIEVKAENVPSYLNVAYRIEYNGKEVDKIVDAGVYTVVAFFTASNPNIYELENSTITITVKVLNESVEG